LWGLGVKKKKKKVNLNKFYGKRREISRSLLWEVINCWNLVVERELL